MLNTLILSRMQFGFTAAFHILWPTLSIGLSFFMLILEIMFYKTKDIKYYQQLRFWAKIFLLTFALGIASGIVLGLQFGTNWANFSEKAGSFFGNIIGFETTTAFALEAGFLGLFLYGWNRISKGAHLFSNFMVFFANTLSAFWIMAANSWMQIPTDTTFVNGKFIISNYLGALFNPDTLISFSHMVIATIESSLFFITGIAAIVILSKKKGKKEKEFFLLSFKIALIALILITPLQIFLGDQSGLTVAKYQPAKLAASELYWNTNSPNSSAGWNLIAWPNSKNNGNAFSVQIPDGLSILIDHSYKGQIEGLNSIPVNQRPASGLLPLIFYSFRLMILIGFFFFIMMIWGIYNWKKGKLKIGVAESHPIFWKLWIFALPLGYIAILAGWIVREVGRQPWIVEGLMKVQNGISTGLNPFVVLTILIVIIFLYLSLFVSFVYFTKKIIAKGPNLEGKLPKRWS